MDPQKAIGKRVRITRAEYATIPAGSTGTITEHHWTEHSQRLSCYAVRIDGRSGKDWAHRSDHFEFLPGPPTDPIALAEWLLS